MVVIHPEPEKNLPMKGVKKVRRKPCHFSRQSQVCLVGCAVPFFCHDVIILLHARREKKRPLEIFFHIKMPFSRALKMDMKTMKLFPPSAYFFAC